jgi:hypothetical protein
VRILGRKITELVISAYIIPRVQESDMVAHTCNPSYSGDRRIRVEGQPRQKSWQVSLAKNKLDIVLPAYNPSFLEGGVRRIMVQF